MRADRLVATLLLLQSRGRLTSAQVAAEMEVSERTARRDLEALALSGVPVYSAQGRGGGWSLVGGARTNLTGLTSDEARALFLVAGPAGAATPQVRTALRKLVQALPAPLRESAEAASTAVVVDPSTWGRQSAKVPRHLGALEWAVVDGQQVLLAYAGRDKPASERVVSPLGLVDKGGVWYLVAGTDAGVRTFRVSRVTGVTVSGGPVVRPEGFDLTATWARAATEVEQRRAGERVVALADPAVLGLLRAMLGSRLVVGEAAEDGRVSVEMAGPSVRFIAVALAGFGAQVEVVAPDVARTLLAAMGEELRSVYG